MGSLTNGWQLSVGITFFALINSCLPDIVISNRRSDGRLFGVSLDAKIYVVHRWNSQRKWVLLASVSEQLVTERSDLTNSLSCARFFRDISPNLRFFVTILGAEAFLLPDTLPR